MLFLLILFLITGIDRNNLLNIDYWLTQLLVKTWSNSTFSVKKRKHGQILY